MIGVTFHYHTLFDTAVVIRNGASYDLRRLSELLGITSRGASDDLHILSMLASV